MPTNIIEPQDDQNIYEHVSRTTTAHEQKNIQDRLRGSIYDGMIKPDVDSDHEYTAPQIIEFCLDVGELMLTCGAAARSVEITIVALAATWNLGSVELEFPSNSILMVYSPPHGTSHTGLRVVRSEAANLHRLNQIYSVVDDVLDHKLDMGEASVRLAELNQEPPTWNSWVGVIATGVLASAIAFGAGGTSHSSIGAFITMTILMLVGNFLGNRAIPPFYTVGCQAFLLTLTGTLAVTEHLLFARESASMVAACVVLLLPHPSVVAFAQDAVSGFRSMALTRFVGIALIVVGLIVGIPAGIIASQKIAHTEIVPSSVTLTGLILPLAIVNTIVCALANAFAMGSPLKTLPLISVAAVLAQLVQQFCLLNGLGPVLSPLSGAVILGVLGLYFSAKLRLSESSIVVPAFCGALLPALPVAQALLKMIGQKNGAVGQFVLAVGTTMAIGVGLVLGNLLMSGSARKTVHKTRLRSTTMDTTPRVVTDRTEITAELPMLPEELFADD